MGKKNITSSLNFVNYVVDYVQLKNNPNFDDKEVEVSFDIEPEFDINEEKTEMMLVINLSIFENAENNNYPFEMSLKVYSFFRMNINDEPIEKFKTNAIAIIYPYLRSLVTTFTSNSNMSPLILPAINVNKLIRSKQQ